MKTLGTLVGDARARRRTSVRSFPRGSGGGWFKKLAAAAIFGGGLLVIAAALYIPAKAELAQHLMQRAWEKQQTADTPQRPWPWADFTPAARLDFPTQDRSVLALTDAAGESLAFGPTLMAASAQPGERGVAVFAAHRDTHFSFIGNLDPGEKITVETPTGTHTFTVTGSEVVVWNDSGITPHDNGPPRIALVTCWPLDAQFRGPMRYIVWATLDQPPPVS